MTISSAKLSDSFYDAAGSAGFAVFCISTVFIVFFSINAVQTWPGLWGKLLITGACLTPAFFCVIWKFPEIISLKKPDIELIGIALIFFFGILNIVFSEERQITLKTMGLFLLTGPLVFAVASKILNSRARQGIFFGIIWMCFVVFCFLGTYDFLSNHKILLFANNTSPASSIVLLTSAAPLFLMTDSGKSGKIIQTLFLMLGILIMLAIGKRGGVLGLAGMALMVIFLSRGKKKWFIIVMALIITAGGFLLSNELPSALSRNLVTSNSSINRIERYFLALHVFKERPVLGIGLHVPLTKYLKDYDEKIEINRVERHFKKQIVINRNFENILLMGFVEMGTVFTLLYIFLVMWIIKKNYKFAQVKKQSRYQAGIILVPMFGFFLHSLTYDSLLFPNLNWLFHSYLAVLANPLD